MKLTLALFFLLITASYSDSLVIFTLAWETPAKGAVTGYNIYMGERSSVVGDDDRDLSLYAGHIALRNQLSVPVFLTHPTTYFTVTAVNDLGEGPPSNELVVTMNGSMATVNQVTTGAWPGLASQNQRLTVPGPGRKVAIQSAETF